MDGILATSVWILRQCQSVRGTPALEPGARTAHRRIAKSFSWGVDETDAYVQRVRRPGRSDVCGNGPSQELLMFAHGVQSGKPEACPSPFGRRWRDSSG